MAFNEQMVEEIGVWCLHSPELAAERERARRHFFALEDPRPIKYWPGAEESVPRERRFLGYFAFDWLLPSGEKPAEFAIKRLYGGSLQAEALKAVAGSRFVLAVVKSIVGRSVYLELEDESFEVRNPALARQLRTGLGLVAHLTPVLYGHWLLVPGWLVWPFGLGPGIRSSLKGFQMDPLGVERFLEGRVEKRDEEPRPAPPKDETFDKAIARMTEADTAAGREGLVMSANEWEALVLEHLNNTDITAFAQEVIKRTGDVQDVKDLQWWLDLAINIWNNTPQPDRGGKSANEMARP